MSAFSPIRRILTTQPGGPETARFAVDEVVTPDVHEKSGISYRQIFGRDDLTQVPYPELEPYARTMFPTAPSAFRAHVIEFPAVGESGFAASGDYPDRGLPDGWHTDPDEHGMHWTNTVDVVVVVEGEIDLVQGDGSSVTLHPGCVVVQNGAMHAWRRRESRCRLVFVNLAAQLRDIGGNQS